MAASATGEKNKAPGLTWHFKWMPPCYEQLRERFASMRSRVEAGPPGSYWGDIEADEAEVARLVLLLQTNRYGCPWLVPVSRTYTLGDTRPIQPGPAAWAGGNEALDYAIRCRIAIASPYGYVLGFYAAAPRARGRSCDADFEREFHLHSLDDPLIDHHLNLALSDWGKFIDEQSAAFVEPPAQRVRRVAVLLQDLHRDIEHYRMHLQAADMDREKWFRETARSNELTDVARLHWSRAAAVLGAGHRRLLSDLDEILPLVGGIASELEYGLGKDAGKTETRAVKCIQALHRHFYSLADDRMQDHPNGACGYLWWHFDGKLHNNFKEWWAPIALEMHEVADLLAAVSLRPDTPPVISGGSFKTAKLRELTGLGNTTLNKYAKIAGVPIPKRGGNDHTYSTNDVQGILRAIVDNSSASKTVNQCVTALQYLKEIPK